MATTRLSCMAASCITTAVPEHALNAVSFLATSYPKSYVHSPTFQNLSCCSSKDRQHTFTFIQPAECSFSLSLLGRQICCLKVNVEVSTHKKKSL